MGINILYKITNLHGRGDPHLINSKEKATVSPDPNNLQLFARDFIHVISQGFPILRENDQKTHLHQKIAPVTSSHFNPWNKWEVVHKLWVIDKTTEELYLNDPPKVKRLKCLALLVGSAVVHPFSLIFISLNRLAKVLSGAHFWAPSMRKFSLKTRFCEWGKDILKIVLSPIIYVGFLLSTIYGLISPNDGGKVYATLERVAFGTFLLAPCFQPNAQRHLFGAPIDDLGGW